jgi:hypothetical protein
MISDYYPCNLMQIVRMSFHANPEKLSLENLLLFNSSCTWNWIKKLTPSDFEPDISLLALQMGPYFIAQRQADNSDSFPFINLHCRPYVYHASFLNSPRLAASESGGNLDMLFESICAQVITHLIHHYLDTVLRQIYTSEGDGKQMMWQLFEFQIVQYLKKKSR